MSRAERRLLKRTGFGREFKDMGAKAAPRPEGYVLQADSSWGERTRRRVRRERRERRLAVLKYFLLLVLVYGGSLVVVLLLVAGLWDLTLRLIG